MSKLGIFDSGVGGFSVLKEIKKNTDANILYFGDTLNAPYGNKPKEEIVYLIKNIISKLKSSNVTHFVSACNSMSVHTTEELLKELNINNNHYVDMVMAVDKYLELECGSNVLIVGTRATISSGVYQEIIFSKARDFDVFVPIDLAEAIEKDNQEQIKKDVVDILNYAKEINATHILYACTHYPLIHDEFVKSNNKIGWEGVFIDPSIYVAKVVSGWNIEGNKEIIFQSSKNTGVFDKYKKGLL